tara:strand:+ start:2880 stop:4007 length:1128 start_codon:yes stop_codon:yes gene_type:complete
MKKVLFIFGTRPEAIKMAPVIKVFKKKSNYFKTYVAVTAQHREMLDQVLNLFDIKPDFDLNLMSQNQSLESLTSKILIGSSKIYKEIRPDLIFVQGDTTTTFAAALAAFYNKIKVGHIEAGLRTNLMFNPFPEEINRRMTSSLSSFHFPPTDKSEKNLLKEGINSQKVLITGNTVIDALLIVSEKIEKESDYFEKFFSKNYRIKFDQKKIVLVTGHRRESFGQGFESICNAIKKIAITNDIEIIYPVHLNPNVQEPVKKILMNIDNIHLIPPLDYAPFVFLMKKSYLILTDSGGIQEEAPSLGKPVLIMRNSTERLEGIKSGTGKLVGTESESILSEVQLLLDNIKIYNKMSKSNNPYGDGSASIKICDFIEKNL